MNPLIKSLMFGLAALLLTAWYQFRLENMASELGKTKANTERLANVIQQQNQDITWLQQEQQKARHLLKEQAQQLQQNDTGTRSKRHAVQQHLAIPAPGRPDCSNEPLPAAVIGLLGFPRSSQPPGTGNTAAGADPRVP